MKWKKINVNKPEIFFPALFSLTRDIWVDLCFRFVFLSSESFRVLGYSEKHHRCWMFWMQPGLFFRHFNRGAVAEFPLPPFPFALQLNVIKSIVGLNFWHFWGGNKSLLSLLWPFECNTVHSEATVDEVWGRNATIKSWRRFARGHSRDSDEAACGFQQLDCMLARVSFLEAAVVSSINSGP